MKKYRIIITDEAFAEVEAAFAYILEQSPQNGDKWINELFEAVYSLTTMPERCGLARENDSFPQELRCLRHYSHRILYTVDHDFLIVRVHAVLLGSKGDLQGQEL